MSTFTTARTIIAEHLGVDEALVTPLASFIDDLGADSLDEVELVMAFEEEFDVTISEDGARGVLIVKDAVRLIDGLLADRALSGGQS